MMLKTNIIYECTSHEKLKLFLPWVLSLKDDEIESGTDALIENNNAFRILWKTLERFESVTIVVEDKYVDRIYRDSYYMYYSCKHFQYNRYCKRLFLFKGSFNLENQDITEIPIDELEEKFIGTMVIRPLKERAIGRSLLNAKYFIEDSAYLRMAKYSVTMLGKRLSLNAFPYSMQDGETTSCAEITILNLLDYFSQKYQDYSCILPSDICKIAENSSFERRLPTPGLKYELITKIITESGFYPRLYHSNIMEISKFKRILHYYIESGIPVALGIDINTSKHSIICIGHGKLKKDLLGSRMSGVHDEFSNNTIWLIDTADIVDEYYCMDDNKEPYCIYSWEKVEEKEGISERKYLLGKAKPDCITVPLYKRMFLEAMDAYGICTSILASTLIGIQKVYLQTEIATKGNPLIIRFFMASSRSFKVNRIHDFSLTGNDEVKEIYANTPFPKFIWVCELYTQESYPNNAIGEIIIDATSSPQAKFDSLVILHYPNMISSRMPEDIIEGNNVEFTRIVEWKPFSHYTANLTPYEVKED